MSKVKMRCTTCGKWFQSANAKEVTCPDCVQKARREKLAAKTTPSPANKVPGSGNPTRTPPPPPKPKAAPTSHWFDNIEDIKVSQPDQPQRPKIPPSPAPRDTRGGPGIDRPGSRIPGSPVSYRDTGSRGPGGYREGSGRSPGGIGGIGGYRPGGPGTLEGPGYRPRLPMEPGRGQRPERGRPMGKKGGQPPKAKAPRPPTPPRPKREKIPPPKPFVPTPEQVAQVEARYLELATPSEFDGIRTQIAKELGIPKKAVKKIVKELRERQSIPSWWELQTYKGTPEELEKIKAAYLPYLPLPPVGVHKQIAEELSIKPATVYQAIKAIRLEMNLPQYNDPTLHGLEPIPDKKQEAHTEPQAGQEEKTEATPPGTETGIATGMETQAPPEPVETAASTALDANNPGENT